ncbi:unnamed protein product, partial [Linum tenue]
DVPSDLFPISFSSSTRNPISFHRNPVSPSETPNFPSPPVSNFTPQNQKSQSSQLLRRLRQLTRRTLSVAADHRIYQRTVSIDHRVKIIVDNRTMESLGFAYVWFASKASADLAVEGMNGKFFDGRFVLVTIARPGSCKIDRNKTAAHFRF